MPDVSKLNLDGTTYKIKDDDARKYLVVVNEEPVSATKVVVETSEDVIELALQSDVDALSNANDNILHYIKDKTIAIFGDSVSDEDIQWNDTIKNVWTFTFRDIVEPMGATVYNYSRSSRGFCVKDNRNQYTEQEIIANTDLTNVDTVIIFCGLNDFTNSKWVGSCSSTDLTKVWGALNSIATYLTGKNVFVITPMLASASSSIPCVILELYRVVLANWAKKNGYMIINGTRIPGFQKGSSYYNGLHPYNDYTPIIAKYIFSKMVCGGEPFSSFTELKTYAPTSSPTNASNVQVTIQYKEDEIIYQLDCKVTNPQNVADVPLDGPGINMFQRKGIVITNNNIPLKQTYNAGDQDASPNSNVYFARLLTTDTTTAEQTVRLSFRGYSTVLGYNY